MTLKRLEENLFFYNKVKTFWEGYKILKISHLFWHYCVNVKTSGRFFQILWPSQKTSTLIAKRFSYTLWKKIGYQYKYKWWNKFTSNASISLQKLVLRRTLKSSDTGADIMCHFLSSLATAKSFHTQRVAHLHFNNGILLPKFFWPTVRKNCSSDWEKLLKFEAEGREFSKFLRSLE